MTLGVGLGASFDEADGVLGELLDGEDGSLEAVGGQVLGRGGGGRLPAHR